MVPAAEKSIATGRVFDTSVMPGRDLVAFEALRHPVQRGELQSGIARDAGYGCFARKIALNKRLNNIPLKILFEIQDIKRKTQPFGNAASVVNIIK